MNLIFDPTKQHYPRTGPQAWDGTTLYPGENQISDATYERLQDHPDFADLVSRGAVTVEGEPAPMPEPAVIEVVDATKSDPQLSNLSALTIAESEPVIAAETDIDLLSQWRDADDRKGIKELIRDRLRDLSPTL
jgi:hypothetical protein